MEGKKSEFIQGSTNRRSVLYPPTQLVIVSLYTIYDFLCYTAVEIFLTKNMGKKKKSKYREEQIREGSIPIPR